MAARAGSSGGQQTGTSRQWGCTMSPGRQKSAHLALQLWGSPGAAEDGGSLALQHALQGSTLRPARSHQQHRLPTCATQGKSFSRPQRRAQAPAAMRTSPQATHRCSTAEGAAEGLTGTAPCAHSSCASTGSSSGARAVTPTTGLK